MIQLEISGVKHQFIILTHPYIIFIILWSLSSYVILGMSHNLPIRENTTFCQYLRVVFLVKIKKTTTQISKLLLPFYKEKFTVIQENIKGKSPIKSYHPNKPQLERMKVFIQSHLQFPPVVSFIAFPSQILMKILKEYF